MTADCRVPAWLLGIAFTLTVSGCADPVETVREYVYTQPPETGDGWTTSSLEGTGVDVSRLEALVNAARDGTFDRLHSVLLAHRGRLVFEEYFPGYRSASGRLEGKWIEYDRDTKHECQSATKSFRSALVGIAIDQGYIDSVDAPLLSFFPEFADLNTGERSEITLRHLLTMSSGLDWPETAYGFPDDRNPLWQMYQRPRSSWARFVLERPMAATPGSVWNYNTGLSILMKEILDRATASRAESFADSQLFEKMESRPQNGFPFVDFVLPRDMAKLGQVFLSGGWWKETRVVSQEWIDASTQRYFTAPWSPPYDEGYGFQWWLRTLVIEDLDLVVVFTAGYFGSSDPVLDWLEGYVLPAIEG
jgi:CubicO group peptidase (beta-lactamase class C family)